MCICALNRICEKKAVRTPAAGGGGERTAKGTDGKIEYLRRIEKGMIPHHLYNASEMF